MSCECELSSPLVALNWDCTLGFAVIILVARRSQYRAMEAGALFHFGITAVRVLTTIVTKRWTAVVVEVLLLSVVECEVNGDL